MRVNYDYFNNHFHSFSLFRQQSLFDILTAYAAHDPAVGYCQAQAPIASILLMHLPPEQAFWVFIQINEEYVKGYFSDGLIAIKEDALATELLIQQISPKAYRLLVCATVISNETKNEFFFF
jgi:hypothetical protein